MEELWSEDSFKDSERSLSFQRVNPLQVCGILGLMADPATGLAGKSHHPFVDMAEEQVMPLAW